MIETAVVILNWNGKHHLQSFLPKILSLSVSANSKVFIGDNGSTDGSVAYLQEEFPEVTLIQMDRNYGFSEGYNRVLKTIDARYFVLLNSDIEVTQNWLEPMIAILRDQPEVAAVMPKIRSYKHPEYFEHAGAAGGFIDRFGYPFCRGRILNRVEKDAGQYDQETEIFWATGACMVVRAGLYKEMGGFDEFMFAHMEEIDLCWRFKNAGYKVLFTPNSTVFHIGGGTLPNEHPRKLFLNFRNNLILLYKNLPSRKKPGVLLVRMILDGIAALKFLFSLKFRHAFAILKAHMHFYRVLPAYRKARKSLPAMESYPEGVYMGSILFQFYFRGVRKYSSLNIGL